MKKLIHSIILVVLFSNLSGQNTYNKTGGVCFRFDDHQPAYKWRDLNALFTKYGYKFNLALNPERILTDTAAYNALREVMASGHELMEHTPSHSTAQISFSTAHKEDTLWFRGKKGIDHITIATGKVCLEVDTFYTENYTGEGLINIYGNTIISVSNGEFKNLSSPINYSNLYLPTKKMLGTWNSLRNKNPNDPDTITVQNYWQETVPLDTVLAVPYHRLTVSDIKMTEDALKLLTDRSLYIYDSLGFSRPKSWIQPGGSFAQLNKEEVKELLGAKYGFTAAATYVLPSLKMYNEVDSLQNKRFAIQNPDFSDENNTLEAMKTSIADNSARHANSYTLSHLNSKLAWADYINRMDSLLSWIQDNNIPVRRFNEWATIMFDSMPNPYTNIIPEFYRDLNKNGIPDGAVIGAGTLDSNNGVARSQNIGLSRTANGSFFAINSLGGFEKGWNRFSVYTKGSGAKDSVRIGIGFPEVPGLQMYFNLAANTSDWTEVSKLIYLDPRATRMSFQISASRNVNTGSIQISGVQLRRQSNIKIKPAKAINITTDRFFADIPAETYISDSAYKNNEYTVAISVPANVLQVSINNATNTLLVKKPSLFWVGTDSVKVVANNPDKTTDSGYIKFAATYPHICIGSDVLLKGNAAYGTSYKWYIGPNTKTADSVVVSPTTNTWYKVEYTDLGSNPVTDSIFIEVDSISPKIDFTNDTILCLGNNANLTISNGGDIEWFDTEGNLLQQGNTFTINPVSRPILLYIVNSIKSCVIKDTVNVRANLIKVIQQKLLYKEFIQGKTTSTGFGVKIPAGVKMIPLNMPINTFTILLLNDSVSYTAPSSFRGADSAIYLITDSVCSFDTLILKVVVQKNLAAPQTQAQNITIYPNPAGNNLFIRIDNAATAYIYNVLGSFVLKQPLTAGENCIDITALNKGIYLLKLRTGTGTITQRFVKE